MTKNKEQTTAEIKPATSNEEVEKSVEFIEKKEKSSQELFMEKITNIQYNLKAPKGQVNKFGNYKYRSCEDIVEAVKPLLSEHNLVLKVSDEVELIGDRYYIKATAMICDFENQIHATAYAREPLNKKGMDEAQISGSTSSYSRKYALNGLLCIDDTKDADTQDNSEKVDTKGNSVENKPIPEAGDNPKNESWNEKVTKLAKNHFKTPDEFKAWRIENTYVEDLKGANDFDLLRVHKGIEGLGGNDAKR